MLGLGRRVGQVIKELVVVIGKCFNGIIVQALLLKNNTTDAADHGEIRG